MSSKKAQIRITRRQLERLREAPRSPEVWKEIGVELSDEVLVLVEKDHVRILRKCGTTAN